MVRLESKFFPTNTCILCTHGVLLRTLMGCKQQEDRKIENNLTHVILDEIHERAKFADFLLIEDRVEIFFKKKNLKK